MLTTLILFALLQFVFGDQGSKVVKTAQGPVKGYKSDEGDFYVFYGIPYATTPVGKFKFREPLPGPVWLGTFEATDDTIVCPQNKDIIHFIHKNPTVQENCLVANVYVPDTGEKNLPVVVFIHGGAFQLGYGNFKTPKSLVNQGKFIAVTFNYRLGVHGFLCLGTKGAPGNAGMKDMLALLKWVKKNIANFGGNPDNVTLDGYSAGATATELMLLSKAAKGLFNKVIAESGSALSAWAVQLDPIATAKAFAETNDVITEDVYELEDFFTAASFDVLTSGGFLNNKDSTFGFVPCVERAAKTAFLTEAPLRILKSGDFPKLPSLASYASMEGLFRLDNFYTWQNEINGKFSDFLPADLQFDNNEERENIAAMIKQYYFGDKAISEDTIHGYLDYFGDIIFKYSIVRSTRLQVEAGSQMYLYEYSFHDETSYEQALPKSHSLVVPGATHCAQTNALLEAAEESLDESHLSEEYCGVKSVMRDVVINFIKTGDPVPDASQTFPEGWPTASPTGSPHMNLDIVPKLKGALLEERVEFWDKIYEKFYKEPMPPPKPPTRHSEL